MNPHLFQQYRQLIYNASGISLSNEKVSLLEGRIRKRMTSLQVDSAEHYLEIIQTDLSGNELTLLLDAISTNTTYFFREPEHFTLYEKLLDGYIAQNKKSLRIWCAASSSGEEPYTLAMIAAERRNKFSEIKILATDISTQILQRAVRGRYPADGVSRLPKWMQERYFVAENDLYSVAPAARNLVLFKRLNLVETPFPLKGPIDIIFCRNVMIYFDIPVRQRIVNEFTRLLSPGGHLFLSHSENLLNIQHPLARADSSVFKKGGAE